MKREQAQRERDERAEEHPEVTWLVAEREPCDWAVVKVGLAPLDGPESSATEARPKPDYAWDPRSTQAQSAPYGY